MIRQDMGKFALSYLRMTRSWEDVDDLRMEGKDRTQALIYGKGYIKPFKA